MSTFNVSFSKLSETALTNLLLHEEASFDKIQNKMTLAASIIFVVDSDRFTGSIFLLVLTTLLICFIVEF